MTFREKLRKEHPEYIKEDCLGGCEGCPHEYGYGKKEKICEVNEEECRKCWDREIPETEDKEMTRDDLKDGMVCEQRNGNRHIWLNGMLRRICTCCSGTGMDLKDEDGYEEFDIIRVYTTVGTTLSKMLDYDNLTLIWERKELKEMTLEDIERELGYPVRIVSAEGQEA